MPSGRLAGAELNRLLASPFVRGRWAGLLVPKLRLGVCRAKPEMRGLAPRKRQEETHRSIPVGEPRGKSHPAKARWRAGSESHVNHRGDLGTKLGGA